MVSGLKANKNTRDIINPYNQEVIFTVSEGTKEDAERAILAARRAFESGEWSQETAETRGKKYVPSRTRSKNIAKR